MPFALSLSKRERQKILFVLRRAQDEWIPVL